MDKSGLFDFEFQGKIYSLPPDNSLKTNVDGMNKLKVANRLMPYSGGETIRYKLKLSDYLISPISNL